jgi:hypothetical protein
MYLYFILTGDTASANQLVADGKVTLDEEYDDEKKEDDNETGAEGDGGV